MPKIVFPSETIPRTFEQWDWIEIRTQTRNLLGHLYFTTTDPDTGTPENVSSAKILILDESEDLPIVYHIRRGEMKNDIETLKAHLQHTLSGKLHGEEIMDIRHVNLEILYNRP